MKPKLILLAIFLFICSAFSCTKMQEVQPVKNELFGVWVNSEKDLQFTIQNTNGSGDAVRFTDMHNGSKRFLKVEMYGHIDTYQIASLDGAEMNLIDSLKSILQFKRVSKPLTTTP